MPYEGVPFTGYHEQSVSEVRWSAGRMFTSEPTLFWYHYHAGKGGDIESQRTALALQAANCGCPVPGNALASREKRITEDEDHGETTVDKETVRGDGPAPDSPAAGGEKEMAGKEEAWDRTVKDYADWAATIDFLIHYLLIEQDADTAELQNRKIGFLSMEFERTPGPFVCPDWPLDAHQEDFQRGVKGVVNPISFAVGRIFREGRNSIADGEDARNYWLDLAQTVSDLDQVTDEVDFLLQIADHAIDLGADRDVVIKSILSEGYLIAENNLNSLKQRILDTIDSRRYLNLIELFWDGDQYSSLGNVALQARYYWDIGRQQAARLLLNRCFASTQHIEPEDVYLSWLSAFLRDISIDPEYSSMVDEVLNESGISFPKN